MTDFPVLLDGRLATVAWTSGCRLLICFPLLVGVATKLLEDGLAIGLFALVGVVIVADSVTLVGAAGGSLWSIFI